ncbi:MAG TPA: metalloregulator ArsR/SmtB family transcription factor [Thermomicrobiales bacterium]|jgi:rhodanese-related sulfurtransferase/DNA-binding MarR family transcriptional regulator
MNSSHRAFKDPLFDQFARIGKAVANPHRLELLDLLAQGERRVEDLAAETALSVANASQHLQALRQAGLVETRRAGTSIFYRLADERVFRLWQAIREVGEARLAEIDRLTQTFLTDRAQLEAVDATTLLRRLGEGEVVVLDVRPEQEFRAGHIPEARSIPIDELAGRLGEVPRDREIVAYCRGPYCVFSDEAVALLRAHGYDARRLDVGLPDWRSAGLPVATE